MISKSRFMNLIRCPRFCALEEIKKHRMDAIVTFEDIMEEERKSQLESLLTGMYEEGIDEETGEEFEIDLIDKKNEQLEIMLPYYQKVEMLAGDAIQERFGGDVMYSLNTYEQKNFSVYVGDYKFHCFIDGYQEKDDTFNIFEVKSTTSNKFINMTFGKRGGEKHSLFQKTPSGIIRLIDELYTDLDSLDITQEMVDKAKSKLYDKYSGPGKYVYDLAFQRFVIEKGLIQEGKQDKIDDIKYYLVVLNPKYVYDGERYTSDIVDFIDLTKVTKHMLSIIEADINKVFEYLDVYDASPCKLNKKACGIKTLRECKFKSICFKEVPKKNSILTYMANHCGFKDDEGVKHDPYDLIQEGNVYLDDIPVTWLERENNIIQRRVFETKKPFVNQARIKQGISMLRYPIYHFDFESFPCPIPRFKGEWPYMQSLFQFSIHVETSPGVCDKEKDHLEFLSKDNQIDERKVLVEKMIEYIDTDKPGTILVYNQTFEKGRIKELAKLFPEYSDKLMIMHDMVFDLMDIIKGSKTVFGESGINFYHEGLQGSYSIKKVLPIFSNLTYEGMGVANGNEAMVTYAAFNGLKNTDPMDYEIKVRDLIAYCKQDTWAMVEILDKLRDI